jgi:hypothetical protein
MRADALGLWWRDEPIIKEKKEVIKRTPPEPVWLKDDYLPGLEEAQRFNVPIMRAPHLLEARARNESLLFDVECFYNYFLCAFASVETGAVAYCEMHPQKQLDINTLGWIVTNFRIIGFNSYSYDIPIISMALAGKSCADLKKATNLIILDEWRAQDVLKQFKVKALKPNHIDLIEVAPLRASLKIYGGRLHAPRMQDLPFHPEATLSPPQQDIVRWYCVNDLTQTGFLYEALKEQISLREDIGNKYNLDLRSKSDAQMAEAVITAELTKLTGHRPQRPEITPGTTYYYRVPYFLHYHTPLMNWALSVVANAKFVVAEHGSIEMPPELSALKLNMAGSTYTMGIGGLHSTEERTAHIEDENYILSDRDVVSYYPQIILNLGLCPPHLGLPFLTVYKGIVDRRVAAKRAGRKVEADSLKITVNGTFGKLGSKYSILYAPDLLMQVTLTGQLSLLMLIERLELQGISVVSANTDGIVIKCPRTHIAFMDVIVKQWETDTGFETEETRYKAYYSRDVNNYLAIKEDGKTKTKGAYSNPWNDPKLASFRMHKNPTNTICVEAVENLLTKGVQLGETIRNSRDIRKFVSVRHVKGGAVKEGVYLGKAIRWYYAEGEESEMVYATSGNKVPRTDGAKPLMALPKEFPSDVNYAWYEAEAIKILHEIAYYVDK